MKRSCSGNRALFLWSLLAPLCLPLTIRGQDTGPPFDASGLIDRRIEDQWHDEEAFDPDGADPEAPGADLIRHPLRLNTTSAARLSEVPGLTADQARLIVRHRNLNGPFEQMNDLLRINGIDQALVEKITPFLEIEPAKRSRPGRSIVFDQRVQRRLELGRGYGGHGSEALYPGSPYRIFSRLEIAPSGRSSFAVTGEKDPGERWEFSPRARAPGFDSMSLYGSLEDIGPIERLIVGDFHVRVGLGVHLWTSGRFSGLHMDPAGAAAPGKGISPHRSGGETAFLRGGAATIRLPLPMRIHLFLSRRGRDARFTEMPDSDPEDPSYGITSMPVTGLHRTVSERTGKNAVKEHLSGLAMEWSSARTSVGLIASHLNLDRTFFPEAPLYRRLQQARLGSTAFSLYATTRTTGVRGSGEIGRDADGTWAWAMVLRGDLGPRSGIVAAHRHYPASYAAPRGGGPGRRSGAPWNEVGWLVALDGALSKWVSGRFAADVYRYPGPRFDSLLPARGSLLQVSIEARPGARVRIDGQLLHTMEEKPLSRSDRYGRPVPGLETAKRTSARISLETTLNAKLRLRVRLASTRARSPGGQVSHGVLLFHEVTVDVSKSLRVMARVAGFDASDYAARLGSAEADLIGSPLRATLQGRGDRSYVMVDIRPNSRITLRLKVSSMQRNDVDVIGSGPDLIDGNRLRELRGQLLYRSRGRKR